MNRNRNLNWKVGYRFKARGATASSLVPSLHITTPFKLEQQHIFDSLEHFNTSCLYPIYIKNIKCIYTYIVNSHFFSISPKSWWWRRSVYLHTCIYLHPPPPNTHWHPDSYINPHTYTYPLPDTNVFRHTRACTYINSLRRKQGSLNPHPPHMPQTSYSKYPWKCNVWVRPTCTSK